MTMRWISLRDYLIAGAVARRSVLELPGSSRRIGWLGS
jgi:hypothetical protein